MRKILFWLVSFIFVITPLAPVAAADPMPPTNLVAVPGNGQVYGLDTMVVALDWDRSQNPGIETGWDVYISYDQGANYVLYISNLPLAQTQYTVTNLNANRIFYFRVWGTDGASQSDVPATVGPVYTNSAVSNIEVINQTQTSFDIVWDGEAKDYWVQNLDVFQASSWQQAKSKTITGQTCGQTVHYSLTSRNLNNVNGKIEKFTASTLPCPAPVVSSVTTGSVTQTSISLSWVANATASALNVTTGVSSGARSQPNYTFNNLSCGATYNFQVVATNAAGQSSAPYNHSAATAACPNNQVSPAITSFTVSQSAKNSIALTWTGVNSVQFNISNTTDGTSSGWVTDNNYTFTNLTCGKTYSFSALSRNSNGTLSTPVVLVASTQSCDGQNNNGVILPASCPSLSPHDMVKISGKPAIYVLTNLYEVRYFASGDEFKSWNSDDSYSGKYKIIPQSCFDGLSMPAAPPYHVFFRPGSYVIRPINEPDNLYVMEPRNTVTKITPAAAKALYGKNYSVKVVGLSEWTLYVKSGRTILNDKPHAGMLVRVSGKVWYVTEALSLREVTDEGKLENRFKDSFIHTVPSSAVEGYATANPIVGYESSLTSRLGL